MKEQTRGLTSREDVLNLEIKMEKGFKEQTRWMLGIFITLALMILGLYVTLLLKR